MTLDHLRRIGIVRRIYLVQLIAGFGMLAMGLIGVPAVTYSMLDVVLSPAELLDDAKLDATLSLLQRPNALYMATWIAAGVFLIGTSIAGRRLTRPMLEPMERPE